MDYKNNQKLIKNGQKIRVRMAPSPTGALHVGTARTALFNYLFAKHYGGKFILRIEDTDKERSKKEWEINILDGLRWLGISWDELYKQSERTKTYKTYLEKLLKEDKAFYCWHTLDELQKEQAQQITKKEASVHICKYRNEKNINKKKIERSIIRLKNNNAGKILFYDFVRGSVKFDSKIIGDFSIAKNLNTPLYNFAVVVDDHEMKISHIIRGEDHIPNTPKQILVYEALGIKPPKFIHLPLLLGPDKSKLSKRHGATSIWQYRKLGYLPNAMFNFLSLLGWRPKDDKKELMSKNEVVKEFAVEDIQQSGAIFDTEKLSWMNGEYIRKMPLDILTELCIPYLEKAGFIKKLKIKSLKFKVEELQEEKDFEWLQKVIALEQSRIRKISEITEVTEFIFENVDYEKKLLIWKKMDIKSIKKVLDDLINIVSNIKNKDWTKQGLEKIIMPHAEEAGDRGIVLWPLRVALTGKKASPGPFEIMEVLGKEKTLERINEALELL